MVSVEVLPAISPDHQFEVIRITAIGASKLLRSPVALFHGEGSVGAVGHKKTFGGVGLFGKIDHHRAIPAAYTVYSSFILPT